jgi:serine/threonine protein kinase
MVDIHRYYSDITARPDALEDDLKVSVWGLWDQPVEGDAGTDDTDSSDGSAFEDDADSFDEGDDDDDDAFIADDDSDNQRAGARSNRANGQRIASSSASTSTKATSVHKPKRGMPVVTTKLLGSVRVPLKSVKVDAVHEFTLNLRGPSSTASSASNGRSALSSSSLTSTTPVLHLEVNRTMKRTRVDEEDFDKLRVIGRGSFGKVFQVKKKDTGRIYAMKVLRKDHVVKSNAVKHTMAENRVLKTLKHPFIVSLKYAFQTQSHLYMVIDYMNGGELFYHLTNEDYFSEERTRFYAAQVVAALAYLHSHAILYRDLKPENVLLDMEGNVCLVDFGLCKEGMGPDTKTFTFCGSPEYLAPELLQGKGYGKEIDWWSLGTLIYEMLTGLPPFWDEDEDVMHRRILSAPLKLPNYLSPHVKDLLKGLLHRNPAERLGAGINGAQAIKKHPWFRSIDWEKLERKEVSTPFKPHLSSLLDMRYFDQQLAAEQPMLSVCSVRATSELDQRIFAGFSYDGDHDLTARLSLLASGPTSASVASAVRKQRANSLSRRIGRPSGVPHGSGGSGPSSLRGSHSESPSPYSSDSETSRAGSLTQLSAGPSNGHHHTHQQQQHLHNQRSHSNSSSGTTSPVTPHHAATTTPNGKTTGGFYTASPTSSKLAGAAPRTPQSHSHSWGKGRDSGPNSPGPDGDGGIFSFEN